MKYARLSSVRLVVASLFAFCILGLSTAQAQDRHVRVINETSRTLVKLYFSNVDDGYWRTDRFGLFALSPDYSVLVNVDDGTGYCHFDLKAVFSDGSQVIRRNADVCTLERWTIYD